MNKKYRSFKYKLGFAFFLVQMVIIIFIGIIHYLNVNKILCSEYSKNQNLLEDKIISSVRSTDACYFITENNLLPKINDLTVKIIKEYNSINSIDNLKLDKYRQDETIVAINIIDKNDKIIKSTDDSKVGIDYSKDLNMDVFLNDVRVNKIFMNNRIGMALDGKSIIKPTYEVTDDGNYIIMIESDMRKYTDTIRLASQDFDNIFDSIRKSDANLMNMEIFTSNANAFGSKNQETKLKQLYSLNKSYIEKTMVGKNIINLYKTSYKKEVIYKFIPYKLINSSSSGNTNVIYIQYDNSLFYKNLRNNLLITLLSMASAFILAAVFGIIAGKHLTEPLQRIFIGIKNISKGNFDYKLEVYTNDEFGVLCHKFNDMVTDLDNLYDEREFQSKEIMAQKDEINALYQQTNAMNKELFNLLDKQKINYLSTVKALANAIEAKDKYTEGHCKRVTRYCLAIAKELNLSEEEMDNIHFAALLHDIGKIGIPSSIINKKGKLTDEEFEIIKKHPQIGYDILKNVEFLKVSNEVILQHHERMDGKGYPNALRTENITLLSKILAVADSYDAMTSSRPYRPVPLTIQSALIELENNMEKQFDAQVVEIFIKIMMKE